MDSMPRMVTQNALGKKAWLMACLFIVCSDSMEIFAFKKECNARKKGTTGHKGIVSYIREFNFLFFLALVTLKWSWVNMYSLIAFYSF